MTLIRRAEIIPHNGKKKKKQMLPLVTSWNMDDSYIIDDLLSRGGRCGPGGPHGTQGHGGSSGCCLPCLPCPHVEGSWVTAKDEENGNPKSLDSTVLEA